MKRRFPVLSRQTLALISLGIGVIGIAFTLRPPEHTSPFVFWSVLSIGVCALLLGGAALLFLYLHERPPSPEIRKRERHLVAVECGRVSDSLRAFMTEQEQAKPRLLPFGNGVEKMRRWREEVRTLYRKEFRTWALETFDAAANLNGVARSSRSFVENPSPDQLGRLLDLFRDASQSLERR